MEILKYQDLKAKEIILEEKDSYTYDIRDSMPLRYVHWYWLNQLFPRVREFQEKNADDRDLYQHEANRLIPDDYDDFDYFDNQYLEWYICRHSRIYYKEENFYDAVGYGTWSEQVIVDFDCQMTLFANDKIRVCYFIKQTEVPYYKFVNTNPTSAAQTKWGKLALEDSEYGIQSFSRTNSFRQDILTEFKEEMNGMDTYAALFEAR